MKNIRPLGGRMFMSGQTADDNCKPRARNPGGALAVPDKQDRSEDRLSDPVFKDVITLNP